MFKFCAIRVLENNTNKVCIALSLHYTMGIEKTFWVPRISEDSHFFEACWRGPKIILAKWLMQIWYLKFELLSILPEPSGWRGEMFAPYTLFYLIFFLFTWISIRYYWMMFESAKVTHIFSKEANRRTVRHSKTGSVVDCFPLYLPSLLGKMHIYFIASNLNGQPKDLQERKCRTISSFSILEFQTI